MADANAVAFPSSSGDAFRVLAYCHDGVGIGHLRRTLTICEDIAGVNDAVSFLLVTGSPYVSLMEHGPRLDFLKLPALAKRDNRNYHAKFLAISDKHVLECRTSLLLETTRLFSPDLLLVDKAPAGVCGELVPTLRWLRENAPATHRIFGMRDIEDESSVTIRQWSDLARQAGFTGTEALFEDGYNEIWVYGSRGVFDVGEQYQLTKHTRAKLRYMGYLVRRGCDHDVSSSNGARQVLVTVGGGTDGAHILDAYLAETARQLAAEGTQSVIVSGPDLPRDDARRLRSIAHRLPGVEWVDFEPCMLCRIRRADLVVTMGGYNTVCEVARNRKPALVIPRTTPRMEQAMRAALWADRGAVEVFASGGVDNVKPADLAREVSRMLTSGINVTAPKLDLTGLDRVRDRYHQLVGRQSPPVGRSNPICEGKTGDAPSLRL